MTDQEDFVVLSDALVHLLARTATCTNQPSDYITDLIRNVFEITTDVEWLRPPGKPN